MLPLRTPSWRPPGRHLNPAKSKQDACKPYVRLQELLGANCDLSGSLLGVEAPLVGPGHNGGFACPPRPRASVSYLLNLLPLLLLLLVCLGIKSVRIGHPSFP